MAFDLSRSRCILIAASVAVLRILRCLASLSWWQQRLRCKNRHNALGSHHRRFVSSLGANVVIRLILKHIVSWVPWPQVCMFVDILWGLAFRTIRVIGASIVQEEFGLPVLPAALPVLQRLPLGDLQLRLLLCGSNLVLVDDCLPDTFPQTIAF